MPARLAPTGTVALANGGTGSTTASAARTALGLSAVAASGNYADLSGAPVTPITNTYTASGAIAPSDRLALVNSASPCAMTLGSGSLDGRALIVKRYGVGAITLTAVIDGASRTLTADSGIIKESIQLRWAAGLSTWLTS